MQTMRGLTLEHRNAVELADLMQSWCRFSQENGELPAVSFSLGSAGNFREDRAVGKSNVNSNDEVDPSVQFEMASQTKLITSIALSCLVRRSVIDIHRPIAEYMPEAARYLDFASVYDLLTHQSGLPRDFYEAVDSDDALAAVIERLVLRFGRSPNPAYSNVGYAVLAALVARVAGESYEDFVDREVLGPLGMRDSSWPKDASRRRVSQYGPRCRGSRVDVAPSPLQFPGAIGLWSTPRDMSQVIQAFVGSAPDVLDVAWRRSATAVQWGPAPKTGGREFGLGLEVMWLAGRRWFGHSGGSPGCLSATYLCPETGNFFSVAINVRTEQILEQLVHAFAVGLEVFSADTTIDRSPFADYVGTYEGECEWFSIFITPSKCLLVDPVEWNPFREAHELVPSKHGGLKVVDSDFSVSAMPIWRDGDRIRIGLHNARRIPHGALPGGVF